jgi:hypothetical protein
MPVHLQDHLQMGQSMPGLFTLNVKMALGETAAKLFFIWAVADADEFRNQIWYLPLSY